MNLNQIINQVTIKLPFLAKIIRQIDFKHLETSSQVAFLQGNTLYYTDKLFSLFSFDEQIFIIAHEIMHYFIHQQHNPKTSRKYDEDLANFIEDAQINQILIKFNFTVIPQGVVLLEDALDYQFDELHDMLLPIKKELFRENNWAKYTSVSAILNDFGITNNPVTKK